MLVSSDVAVILVTPPSGTIAVKVTDATVVLALISVLGNILTGSRIKVLSLKDSLSKYG